MAVSVLLMVTLTATLTPCVLSDDDGDEQTDEDLATLPRVDGNWGPWRLYGLFLTSCEGGMITVTRSCDNPAPANNGLDCPGSATETISCITGTGPLNGNWGLWSPYGPCSVPCGSGMKTRTRICDNPAPANNGLDCPGSGTETAPCDNGFCPVALEGQTCDDRVVCEEFSGVDLAERPEGNVDTRYSCLPCGASGINVCQRPWANCTYQVTKFDIRLFGYHDNALMIWDIHAPVGKTIVVMYILTSLEVNGTSGNYTYFNDSCPHDFLRIFEGTGINSSAVLKTCGEVSPLKAPITFADRDVRVMLRSNSALTFAGFYIHFIFMGL